MIAAAAEYDVAVDGDGVRRPRRTRNRAEEKGGNDLVPDFEGCAGGPDSDPGCDFGSDEEAGMVIEFEVEVEVDNPVIELEFEFGSTVVAVEPGSGSLTTKGRRGIRVCASGGSVSKRKIDRDRDYDPGHMVAAGTWKDVILS